MSSNINYIYRDFYISYTVNLSKNETIVTCLRLDKRREHDNPHNFYILNYVDDEFTFTLPSSDYDVMDVIDKTKPKINEWYREND